jgi:hypothetical protein
MMASGRMRVVVYLKNLRTTCSLGDFKFFDHYFITPVAKEVWNDKWNVLIIRTCRGTDPNKISVQFPLIVQ